MCYHYTNAAYNRRGFQPAGRSFPAVKINARPLQSLEALDGIEPPPAGGYAAGSTQLRRIAGLSRLSCVTDFRIATVFTLRRSRSFPAVKTEKEERRSSRRAQAGWRVERDSNPAAFRLC